MKRSRRIKVLKRIYWARQWLRYWLDRFLGRYARDISIDGDMASLGQNLCIFSIFIGKGKILRSVLDLIQAIKKQGYDLVIVVNGRKVTHDWFEGAIGYRDILITRPNLGRDFAAYQLATNLLLESKLSIERILYCNDSVFYLDKNDTKNIFHHLISSDHPWIGMTEKLQKIPRLQLVLSTIVRSFALFRLHRLLENLSSGGQPRSCHSAWRNRIEQGTAQGGICADNYFQHELPVESHTRQTQNC
jgi:hypothetical protein